MFVITLLMSLALSQAAPGGAGRVSGRITLEGTNAPVSGARVTLQAATLQSVAGKMPAATMTDEDGRYAFDNVPTGSYNINVEKTGLVPVVLGGPHSPAAPPAVVQVSPGQSLNGVDRRLQKGGIITGRLLDPKGEPLPEVPLNLMRRVTFAGHPAMLVPANRGGSTDDLGEFRISGLASGEYLIVALPRPSRFGDNTNPTSARAPRTTLARTFYPGTTDESAAQVVAVSAGNELNNISFAIQSVQAFRISGIVVNEDGHPVANAMVTLSGDGTSGNLGPGGLATTDLGGRFTIVDVSPGSYRLQPPPVMTSDGFAGVGGVASGSSGNASSQAPPPIVVTDADVSNLRLVVHRQSPRI